MSIFWVEKTFIDFKNGELLMKKFVLLIPILLLSLSIYVNAADCGGAVRCYCGDTVTSNHTMLWYP